MPPQLIEKVEDDFIIGKDIEMPAKKAKTIVEHPPASPSTPKKMVQPVPSSPSPSTPTKVIPASPSTSSRSSFSRRSPGGMGKKRPSLVFDVDDLDLCMALQEEAPAFVRKMNTENPATVKAWATAFGDHPRCKQETDAARLTGLDRDGFLVEVTLKTQTGTPETAAILEEVRVPYQGKVESVEGLYQEAASMEAKAFHQLGFWFKTQNGYYPKAAKESAVGAYKTIKENPLKTSAVLVGVAAVGVGIAFGMRRTKK